MASPETVVAWILRAQQLVGVTDGRDDLDLHPLDQPDEPLPQQDGILG